MAHPFLEAVTSTTTSDAYTVDGAIKNHSVQIIVTGSPTAVEVDVLGSLDDTHYCVIGTKSLSAAEISHGCAIYYIDGYLAEHIKVELTTLTGGTSPTITVLYHGEGAH